MSYGTLGNAAIPDQLQLDYALTGRAACQTCGGLIPDKSVRVSAAH